MAEPKLTPEQLELRKKLADSFVLRYAAGPRLNPPRVPQDFKRKKKKHG